MFISLLNYWIAFNYKRNPAVDQGHNTPSLVQRGRHTIGNDVSRYVVRVKTAFENQIMHMISHLDQCYDQVLLVCYPYNATLSVLYEICAKSWPLDLYFKCKTIITSWFMVGKHYRQCISSN